MLNLQLEHHRDPGAVVALPVTVSPDGAPRLSAWESPLSDLERSEVLQFLADSEHSGAPDCVGVLPRPGRAQRKLLLFGTGDDSASNWRKAGAALARAARRDVDLTVFLGRDPTPEGLGAFAEGLLLASYQYRLADESPERAARLAEVTLLCPELPGLRQALVRAEAICSATCLARDLTNTPSDLKNPAWFAERLRCAASEIPGLSLEIWDPDRLRDEDMGGVLTVGKASASPPRLVQLDWAPPAAGTRVVLVGKGITFDTGGICLKPLESMKLMRKDMGAAASVTATVLACAALNLPVRVTALAPLAENSIGAEAFRPGDVVRHPGGITTEVLNTDAEGRLVLADALAYAAANLRPDVLLDMGTLTGAQSVALGKRTAALFTEDSQLAAALSAAADSAGESLWRLPLVEEYTARVEADLADLRNSVEEGGAGCITAALFLREFTGACRKKWVHLDMSAPAWCDSPTDELARGATGWGVRTLVRWLESIAGTANRG